MLGRGPTKGDKMDEGLRARGRRGLVVAVVAVVTGLVGFGLA